MVGFRPPGLTEFKKPRLNRVNSIGYGGGGGGGRIQPSNLVTCSFYLLGTFWMNFSKIDQPGGLLLLIF